MDDAKESEKNRDFSCIDTPVYFFYIEKFVVNNSYKYTKENS
jgi:hypothetical protein